MSSEISTDVQSVPAHQGKEGGDAGFQPWQLFTLAGLVCAAIVAFYAGSRPPSVRVALILIVFAAAAIGLASLGALAPLTGRRLSDAPVVLGGRTRAALERDKALVLRSLKELEFDRAMGKVSEKDFAEMSARLRSRAARILRQLDAGSVYRTEIEREVEKRLGGRTLPDARPEDDRRAAVAVPHASAASAHECAGCGTANDPDARFCKGCGKRLEEA